MSKRKKNSASPKSGRKPKSPRKRIGKIVAQTEDVPHPVPNISIHAEADDDPWGDDGLTIRQRAFVEALVGPAGGNATRAAEMAGYASENRLALQVTASENLAKPMVAKAIALALAKKRLTPEWAKNRLVDLASADMNNFLSRDANGSMKVDWNKAVSLGAVGQIQEYDPVTGRIKLHKVGQPLATILKLFGLLNDTQMQPNEVRIVKMRPIKPKTEKDDASD